MFSKNKRIAQLESEVSHLKEELRYWKEKRENPNKLIKPIPFMTYEEKQALRE
jgi:hypothetical protein